MEKKEIHVLIVDDDKEDYLLAKEFLIQIETTAYKIDWEPDYCEAFNTIARKQHDVYIIDYNLNSRDSGVDLVRQLNKKGINKPFIFLTGMDDITIDMEAMKVGATDYLIKNRITGEILERSIRYAMQQKKVENELKEANATKDKLFSIISHDLRSPLSTLMNSLDLMIQEENDISDEIKNEILNELAKSSRSVFNLLDNLLSWSRSQIDAQYIEPVLINVPDLISDVYSLMEVQANRKSINLVNKIPTDTKVFADKNMAHLIFRNLVTNAIKFTPESGKVMIGARKKNNRVEILVQDTGVGIAEDEIDQVLNPNIYKTTKGTGNEEGNGLGLKIVQEFVSKNNGSLRVESTPGKGSTFYVELPCKS